MKQTATLFALALFAAGAAHAQPARTNNGALTDQIVARDVGGAMITLDGTLDEAEWDAAESIDLTYDGTGFIPGGGYGTLGGPYALDAPTDGVDGELRVLRKGNMIYVGLTVLDKSIGGSREFFQHDGLVMTMQDHRRRDDFFARSDTSFVPNYGNYTNNIGILYSWLNRGVGSLEAGQDTVGQAPTVDGSRNPRPQRAGRADRLGRVRVFVHHRRRRQRRLQRQRDQDRRRRLRDGALHQRRGARIRPQLRRRPPDRVRALRPSTTHGRRTPTSSTGRGRGSRTPGKATCRGACPTWSAPQA